MAIRYCRHYDQNSISSILTQLVSAVNAAGLTVGPPPTALAAEPEETAEEEVPTPDKPSRSHRAHR